VSLLTWCQEGGVGTLILWKGKGHLGQGQLTSVVVGQLSGEMEGGGHLVLLSRLGLLAGILLW